MAADWITTETLLCCSANGNEASWVRHGQALMLEPEHETEAFDLLLINQSEDGVAQNIYKKCRESNPFKFWSLAHKYWSPTGSKPEKCLGLRNQDARYLW
jgi:hypothetical protein